MFFLFRKIGEIGLKTAYENDEIFAQKIKCIASLAFIKPKQVYDVITENVPELFPDKDEKVDKFLEYFTTNHIGEKSMLVKLAIYILIIIFFTH